MNHAIKILKEQIDKREQTIRKHVSNYWHIQTKVCFNEDEAKQKKVDLNFQKQQIDFLQKEIAEFESAIRQIK
jgi:polyhydroxyalkanoate synthesis regulator protein